MIQSQNESIDHIVTRLKVQSAICEFPNIDEIIRDQLIDKCASGKLRFKILENQHANQRTF